MKMKKIVYIAAGLFILSGCSSLKNLGQDNNTQETQKQSQKAQNKPPVKRDFNSEADSAAMDITKKLLSSTTVSNDQSNTPLIFIEGVKNNTNEYINTNNVKDIIKSNLVDSGKYGYPDSGKISEVKNQLGFNENDDFVNQSQIFQFSKMIGANYVVRSNINGNSNNYFLSMNLIDIKSGAIKWSDKVKLGKKGE